MKKTESKFIQNLIGKQKYDTLKKFLFEADDKEEEEEKEEMGSATLEDGTPIEFEGDLAVGTVVNVVTEEGTMVAPAGTHVLSTGQTIVIEGDEGVVASIEEAATPEPDASGEIMKAVSKLEKEIQSSVKFNKQRFEAIEKENKMLKQASSTILEAIAMMSESMEVKTDRNDKFSKHESNAKHVSDKVSHLTELLKKSQQK